MKGEPDRDLLSTVWDSFVQRLPEERCERCKAVGRLSIVTHARKRLSPKTEGITAQTMCKLCGHRDDWEAVHHG